MSFHDCEVMKLQFHVHFGQEFSQSELQWLVQKLFSQELLQRLGIEGLLENVCILVMMEQVAHNRRRRQVGWYTMFKPSVFKKLWELNFVGQCFEARKVFLTKCFQMPFSEEIPKVVLRGTSRLSIYFCSQISDFSFLPNCSHLFSKAP